MICGWCSATNPDGERIAVRTLELVSRWSRYAAFGRAQFGVFACRLTGERVRTVRQWRAGRAVEMVVTDLTMAVTLSDA